MTFVSSMEKPSHKKCDKQSKRRKNSLFKLTMAGLLRKAEGNLGKTNLLKQTIYWSTNIHILQSPKNHRPSLGTKVWAIRNWNPKNQITLVEPVQRDVNICLHGGPLLSWVMNLYKLESWPPKKFDSKLLSLHDFIGSFNYHPHPHPTSPQKIGFLVECEEENMVLIYGLHPKKRFWEFFLSSEFLHLYMYQDKCFVSFPQTILRWNGYNFMF